MVVDLSDPHPSVEPGGLQALLARVTLCLLPGHALISPQWLDLAAQPGVHVLAARSRQTGDATVTELLRLVEGPDGGRVADLVLSAEPALGPVHNLVKAVCLDPWSIRRPRDLAIRCRMSLPALKRQCVQVGFARIEHFIICVRLLAYEQLVVAEHLPTRIARARAGFTDPSNMRRHAHRAAQHSPMVERALLHHLKTAGLD